MTDRGAHLERDTAQPEAAYFFNQIGAAKKNRDGVSGDQNVQCPYCRKWHTHHSVLIPHTDVGVADYLGSVKTYGGHPPYSFVCEVKAGGVAFPMNRIAEEQWSWMRKWECDTNGTAWFWIMIGDEAVNAVVQDEDGKSVPSPFRRSTYLVPLSVAEMTMSKIEQATKGAQSILYASDAVPHQKYKAEYARMNLYADQIWAAYRLVWKGSDIKWYLPAYHPWNIIYAHMDISKVSGREDRIIY